MAHARATVGGTWIGGAVFTLPGVNIVLSATTSWPVAGRPAVVG